VASTVALTLTLCGVFELFPPFLAAPNFQLSSKTDHVVSISLVDVFAHGAAEMSVHSIGNRNATVLIYVVEQFLWQVPLST
jgi:hypothetical protein